MNDPTIVRLARIIQQGWPDGGKELPDDIKVYLPYTFELHIVNGILSLQHRIIIPIGLRWLFLNKVHDTHLGIVKSKLLGRTLIYWPNWNNDIKKMCLECDLCRENQMIPVNVPKFQVNATHPGETYGVDIADIQGKPNLVCVDYKSCCIFKGN